MTLKKFILLLVTFVISSLITMIYFPDHSYLLFVFMLVAAVISELGRMFIHAQKSKGSLTSNEILDREPHSESEEFHNDFSKVPAGVQDPNSPIPMPRGMIIGDPYKRFEENLNEDLRSAGLLDEQVNKPNTNKDDKKEK